MAVVVMVRHRILMLTLLAVLMKTAAAADGDVVISRKDALQSTHPRVKLERGGGRMCRSCVSTEEELVLAIERGRGVVHLCPSTRFVAMRLSRAIEIRQGDFDIAISCCHELDSFRARDVSFLSRWRIPLQHAEDENKSPRVGEFTSRRRCQLTREGDAGLFIRAPGSGKLTLSGIAFSEDDSVGHVLEPGGGGAMAPRPVVYAEEAALVSAIKIHDCSFSGFMNGAINSTATIFIMSETSVVMSHGSAAVRIAMHGDAASVNVSDSVLTSNLQGGLDVSSRGRGGARVRILRTELSSNAVDSSGDSGGGARIAGAANVEVDEIQVAGNYGGGLVVSNASRVVISRSTFVGNSRSLGGGAHLDNVGSIVISDSSFESNRATMFGGALSVSSASCTVLSSTFTFNRAPRGAGAINVSGVVPNATLHVTGSEFADNSSSEGRGGAILVDTDGASAVAIGPETIFASNFAYVDGGALFLSQSTSLILTDEHDVVFIDNECVEGEKDIGPNADNE